LSIIIQKEVIYLITVTVNINVSDVFSSRRQHRRAWCKSGDSKAILTVVTVQHSQIDLTLDCWRERHGHQQHTWNHCMQLHQHRRGALPSVNTASIC